MKVVDIADEIHRELGSPTDVTVPALAFWLVRNAGGLNNYLGTVYIINENTVEISPELGETEKYIFKKMYLVHYYDIKLRASMSAVLNDDIIEVSDQGSTVRKVNKNEVSKHFAAIKKQELDELQSLVISYKSTNVTPLQVAGDDTVEGNFPTDASNNWRFLR